MHPIDRFLKIFLLFTDLIRAFLELCSRLRKNIWHSRYIIGRNASVKTIKTALGLLLVLLLSSGCVVDFQRGRTPDQKDTAHLHLELLAMGTLTPTQEVASDEGSPLGSSDLARRQSR